MSMSAPLPRRQCTTRWHASGGGATEYSPRAGPAGQSAPCRREPRRSGRARSAPGVAGLGGRGAIRRTFDDMTAGRCRGTAGPSGRFPHGGRGGPAEVSRTADYRSPFEAAPSPSRHRCPPVRAALRFRRWTSPRVAGRAAEPAAPGPTVGPAARLPLRATASPRVPSDAGPVPPRPPHPARRRLGPARGGTRAVPVPRERYGTAPARRSAAPVGRRAARQSPSASRTVG